MNLELFESQIANVPWLYCPTCRCQVWARPELVWHYIEGRAPLLCPNQNCLKAMDWFDAIALSIKENFFHVQGTRLLGASQTMLCREAEEGTAILIDLTQNGIPEDAIIIHVVCTPQEKPLMVADLNWHIPDKFKSHLVLNLWPVWGGEAVVPNLERKARLAFLITWIKVSEADKGLSLLIQAFRDYSAGRFDATIVPANTAVEMLLTPALTTFLERFCGKKRSDDFLVNGATYSHQLNILLPIACQLQRVPMLPDSIRGELNHLRKLRNDIAHRGKPEEALTESVVARLLTASFFSLYYLQKITPMLANDTIAG